MKSDDIEEVVEPADPNLEPKERDIAGKSIFFHFGLFNKPRNDATLVIDMVEQVVTGVTRGPFPFTARRLPLMCSLI